MEPSITVSNIQFDLDQIVHGASDQETLHQSLAEFIRPINGALFEQTIAVIPIDSSLQMVETVTDGIVNIDNHDDRSGLAVDAIDAILSVVKFNEARRPSDPIDGAYVFKAVVLSQLIADPERKSHAVKSIAEVAADLAHHELSDSPRAAAYALIAGLLIDQYSAMQPDHSPIAITEKSKERQVQGDIEPIIEAAEVSARVGLALWERSLDMNYASEISGALSDDDFDTALKAIHPEMNDISFRNHIYGQGKLLYELAIDKALTIKDPLQRRRTLIHIAESTARASLESTMVDGDVTAATGINHGYADLHVSLYAKVKDEIKQVEAKSQSDIRDLSVELAMYATSLADFVSTYQENKVRSEISVDTNMRVCAHLARQMIWLIPDLAEQGWQRAIKSVDVESQQITEPMKLAAVALSVAKIGSKLLDHDRVAGLNAFEMALGIANTQDNFGNESGNKDISSVFAEMSMQAKRSTSTELSFRALSLIDNAEEIVEHPIKNFAEFRIHNAQTVLELFATGNNGKILVDVIDADFTNYILDMGVIGRGLRPQIGGLEAFTSHIASPLLREKAKNRLALLKDQRGNAPHRPRSGVAEKAAQFIAQTDITLI